MIDLQTIPKLVINLPERRDRLEQLRNELPKLFFNPSFEIIEGVRGSVLSAHLKAIQYAKDKGWKQVLIMEDDLKLSDSPNLIRYVEEAFKKIPWNLEILSGGCYGGEQKVLNEHWNSLSGFAGAHFLIYKAEVYERILNFDFGRTHYDRSLSRMAACGITSSMFATQHNGFSDHRNKTVNDDHYLNGAKLLV